MGKDQNVEKRPVQYVLHISNEKEKIEERKKGKNESEKQKNRRNKKQKTEYKKRKNE